MHATKVESKEDTKTKVEEEEFTDGPDVAPSTEQVQGFLTTLCDDTEIAEVELQMGSFKLKVRRNLQSAAAPVAAAPVAAVPAPAPAAPTPVNYISMDEPSAEESIDEALVYVSAPKVGVFRRGKYAGGKKIGKGNAVDTGAKVKKGQALGYVEQLGTFVAVEAPQAGEVVTFKLADGDPVEYKQVVVELAPFFGGHIIGDSKYA